MTDENKVSAAKARAASLTQERRSAIAKKAAETRWANGAPQANFEGEIEIGGVPIPAAVLPDGTRVLTQSAFLKAIGRARTPKAGTGVLTSDVDEVPFFLRAEVLRPFVTADMATAAKPVHYLSKEGHRRVGYSAEVLPQVCEVYLKYRDACLASGERIDTRFAHLITACDMVMRGLAHVGIVALVDEATGYQEVRDKRALQAILDRFLSKELAAWAKRFPDSFYREMFRLRKWPFDPAKLTRPGVVGHFTNDLIYERLAPGVLKELQERNPVESNGRRRHKHHQWLSDDVGHAALKDHINIVVAFMQASSDWDGFKLMLDRVKPRLGDTMPLNFE